MFDVRPVAETGGLDWEKIGNIKKIVHIHHRKNFRHSFKTSSNFASKEKSPSFYCREKKSFVEKFKAETGPKIKKAQICQLNKFFQSDELPILREAELPEELPEKVRYSQSVNEYYDYGKEEIKNIGEHFKFSDLFLPLKYSLSFNFEKIKKATYLFSGIGVSILIILIAVPFFQKGLGMKDCVLGVSTEGYQDLENAIGNIKEQNFEASSLNFKKAHEKFSEISEDLNQLGGGISDAARYIPYISKFSSARFAIEAGKHAALAGESLNEVARTLDSLKNPATEKSDETVSLLDIFRAIEKNLKTARSELIGVQENVEKINIDDLPEDKRVKFMEIKEKLPEITGLTASFLANSDIFMDLLGGDGPRKYLFLFQNNQEMRATGGFIGSYGLLDINNGHIRKFFVDGIFNPDGQLKDKIVPPAPIQKISAAWSLHDSNWWPDFPTSAKKAILFYEKTGGPTIDGIIAITPAVMEKLLEITGPIEMEEYGVTLDSDNFIEKTQYEVEIDYDKEENQPKKILADLATIVLDRIFNARDFNTISKVLGVLSEGLDQKHILLYSENKDLQKIISGRRWSGEVLNTSGDYLSVINTNINGYKTDGVISENIEHTAEIQDDGSVIDTLIITRKHNGGNSAYEWWNKVNADYMRVYVPLGSKLLEVSGQTREFNDPPLDYDALGFKRDPEVQKEEENMTMDEETGTRTYEESGKTVFANWAYVSPQETVVVKYKYLLPFKIFSYESNESTDSYSLLAQKQAGSTGSKFSSKVEYPGHYNIEWKYPENIEEANGEIRISDNLEIDKFIGVVFTRKNFISN